MDARVHAWKSKDGFGYLPLPSVTHSSVLRILSQVHTCTASTLATEPSSLLKSHLTSSVLLSILFDQLCDLQIKTSISNI